MKKNHVIIISILFLSMFTFSVGETLTQNNSLFLKNSPIFSLKKIFINPELESLKKEVNNLSEEVSNLKKEISSLKTIINETMYLYQDSLNKKIMNNLIENYCVFTGEQPDCEPYKLVINPETLLKVRIYNSTCVRYPLIKSFCSDEENYERIYGKHVNFSLVKIVKINYGNKFRIRIHLKQEWDEVIGNLKNNSLTEDVWVLYPLTDNYTSLKTEVMTDLNNMLIKVNNLTISEEVTIY